MEKKEVLLSKRMQMVADMVTKGNVVADIGCDHGFVSIYLIEQGISPYVIAMDVNEGPLMRAKEHVARKGLNSFIDIRLSDGIEKLNRKEADSIIIAGMGGRLVMKILSEHMDRVKELKEIILQPQSELHLVRRFLAEQGLLIVQEDMVEDAGKFYPCMKAVVQDEPLPVFSETEEWYGPILLRENHPVLYRYLQKEKEMFEQIAKQIQEYANTDTLEDTKEETIRNRLGRIAAALAYFDIL